MGRPRRVGHHVLGVEGLHSSKHRYGLSEEQRLQVAAYNHCTGKRYRMPPQFPTHRRQNGQSSFGLPSEAGHQTPAETDKEI